MSGTLEVNDVIIVKVGKNPKVNDIVTYMDEEGKIVTHRLIRKVGNKYITKGDVNNTEDEPFTDDKLIGVVKSVISPSFVLKLIATFLILFIFLALINFDEVFKKYIVKEDNKVTGSVPDDIFEKEKVKEEKHSGLTVTIPLGDIAKIQEIQEKENLEEEAIEVLETEEIIDIDSNNIVVKEKN